MKNFIIKNKNAIFAAVLALAAFGVFLRVFLSLELYSDDFYYSTFFRDGPASFFEKVKDHFETFNGRTLIHFVIWISLALGRTFTPILMTAVLFAVPLAFAKTEKSNICGVFTLCAFFAMFMMTVSVTVLRESLFWTSGFFNYVLPFLCLILSLILQKNADKKRGFSQIFFFCAAQLLLASTMEQISAATVFATALFGFVQMIRQKKFLPRYLAAPVCGALGFASILLSPATRERIGMEVEISFLSKTALNFADIGSFFVKDGAFALSLVFIAVTAVYMVASTKRLRVLFFALPCTGVFTWVHFFTNRKLATFIGFTALCLYMLVLAIECILKREHVFCGILLLSGLFSVFVIILTSSAGARTSLPLILSAALVAAAFAKDLAELVCANIASQKVDFAVRTASLSLSFCACIYAFSPTFAGYMKNEAVRNANLAAIEEAKAGDSLYYNMDYDEKYAHSLMYDDGYFYNTFAELYGIDKSRIYLISECFPPIYCKGNMLSCPAITFNKKVYFPLRASVEALGGTVKWSSNETRIYIFGEEFFLRGVSIVHGDNVYWVESELKTNF